ncbi:MAG TPA: T9SS type A sorting domain-containing protein, partial [Flavisolibacter sp.]
SSIAYQKGSGVQVEWTAEGETDADRYEVEKSADGRTFTKAGSVKAKGTSGRNAYDWLDAQPYAGNNFYRIKAIETTGKTQYSKVMRVNLSDRKSVFAVYPSPLAGNECSMQLTAVAKGKYLLSLTNNVGQQVWSKTVEHPGGSSSQTLVLPAALASGIYQISIAGSDWRMSQQVIKN